MIYKNYSAEMKAWDEDIKNRIRAKISTQPVHITIITEKNKHHYDETYHETYHIGLIDIEIPEILNLRVEYGEVASIFESVYLVISFYGERTSLSKTQEKLSKLSKALTELSEFNWMSLYKIPIPQHTIDNNAFDIIRTTYADIV